ncbi:unnamed protein product [Rhizoctonia solani]|uniref:Uncharacterized protein n=1 Tax=Rhizoctonia solani TaxID=456999 RepID=A0A8H3CZL5_9AGAM|nr:unnamed protein product [Rhizoctonia solani]
MPVSKKRKNQLLKVRRAQEGAKIARERRKAEKARQEAEQSQSLTEGLSAESGSADQPRGSEIDSTPSSSGDQAPAAQEAGRVGVQESEVPLGRLRTRRQRVLAQ